MNPIYLKTNDAGFRNEAQILCDISHVFPDINGSKTIVSKVSQVLIAYSFRNTTKYPKDVD